MKKNVAWGAGLLGVLLIVLLSGCAPALNWREHRMSATPLKVLLPCKPDVAEKAVAVNGGEISVHMSGCEAAGMLFAVAWLEVSDVYLSDAAMVQWQAAMLANIKADKPQRRPFAPKGSAPTLAGVEIMVHGQRPDQKPVQARGVWFAVGRQVFHAVVYGAHLDEEAIRTFFGNLENQ